MKNRLTKKLALRKETLASLNNAEKAMLLAGNMDPTNETGCQTECEGGCSIYQTGGNGSGPTMWCYTAYPLCVKVIESYRADCPSGKLTECGC